MALDLNDEYLSEMDRHEYPGKYYDLVFTKGTERYGFFVKEQVFFKEGEFASLKLNVKFADEVWYAFDVGQCTVEVKDGALKYYNFLIPDYQTTELSKYLRKYVNPIYEAVASEHPRNDPKSLKRDIDYWMKKTIQGMTGVSRNSFDENPDSYSSFDEVIDALMSILVNALDNFDVNDAINGTLVGDCGSLEKYLAKRDEEYDVRVNKGKRIASANKLAVLSMYDPDPQLTPFSRIFYVNEMI